MQYNLNNMNNYVLIIYNNNAFKMIFKLGKKSTLDFFHFLKLVLCIMSYVVYFVFVKIKILFCFYYYHYF